MNAPTRTTAAASSPRLTREQAVDLLQRYPRVSEAETKQILGFLRKGPQLDIGMVSADEQLKPQLDSFMRDHARHFRVGVFEGAGVVVAIAAFLVVCWVLWEATRGA